MNNEEMNEKINRLVLVLRMKNLISIDDSEYIRGIISEAEWIGDEDG